MTKLAISSFFLSAVDGLLELQAKTQEFAEELSATVRAVSAEAQDFDAVVVSNRVKVRQQPETGVPLYVNGHEIFALKADFSCVWDLEKRFLAIESSSMGVYAAPSDKQPLFRYEYLRSPHSVPAAHFHIHAHRDSFTYTMARAQLESGRKGRLGRLDEIPSLRHLHFPLGGHRFRPVLEDVLQMLIEEFGIDHDEGAIEALSLARRNWRLTQTKAAVRDAPGAAVESLRGLGYEIYPPSESPAERHMGRLRDI